ncbi:MAG TPA: hypothetical protein VMI75_38035 [Polyangiaceae bacterium]|nr:hypothetical protein [Polyangiaceae bacterium]
MASKRMHRLLVVACACALAALALMTWQLFDPRAFPVVVAMSVGQVLGTASFVAFGLVVLADYRAMRRAARRGGYRASDEPPPPDATGE